MKIIGINWHLRFRLEIETLKNENMTLKIKNEILERKIKKYENDNTRTTGNRKNDNIIKFSG
jgi:cell division protein FtsB